MLGRRKQPRSEWTDSSPGLIAVLRHKLGEQLGLLAEFIRQTPGGISGVLVAIAQETAHFLDTRAGRAVLGSLCLTLAWLCF